jgi:hypothetical protein
VELLGVREWEGGAIAGGDGGEWRELRAHTQATPMASDRTC